MTIVAGMIVIPSITLFIEERLHNRRADLFIMNIEALSNTESGSDSACKSSVGFCINEEGEIINAIPNATRFY